MASNYAYEKAASQGHLEPYDDSFLQRRTKHLISASFLCLIVAGAALVISIMVLLKIEEKTSEDCATNSSQIQPAYNASTDIERMKFQIKQLERQFQATKNKSMDIDSMLLQIEYFENELKMIKENLKGISDFGFDYFGGYYDGSSEISDHEHHHYDSNEHSEHSHDSHSHLHPTVEEQTEYSHNSTVSQPEHSHDSNAHHHSHHVHYNEDSDESADDATRQNQFHISHPSYHSVGVFEEGSGMSNDVDSSFEGSGATSGDDFKGKDCIEFSRPACPVGYGICYTEDECPIPVCCI